MRLRVARHTADLQRMVGFYSGVLGLQVLGSFTAHNGYDGVFIGLNNQSWHLEFTTSAQPPQHKPDEDDLLVFYVDNAAEYTAMQQKFAAHGIEPATPKNPYWQTNATQYTDPDGYGVIIAIQGIY